MSLSAAASADENARTSIKEEATAKNDTPPFLRHRAAERFSLRGILDIKGQLKGRTAGDVRGRLICTSGVTLKISKLYQRDADGCDSGRLFIVRHR